MGLPTATQAMDGYWVTADSRQQGRLDELEFNFLLQHSRSTGLYRFEIRGNVIERSGRICEYPAVYPTISPDGKRIAFYRQATRVDEQGKPRGATGETWHLSVIDADGGNLRDLVTFGKDVTGAARIAWPVGGWVHYVRPQPAESKGAVEIWRVKVDQPRRNERVMDMTPGGDDEARLIRWSLNITGDRMGMRIIGSPYGTGNDAYAAWPPNKSERSRAEPVGDSADTQYTGRIQRCMIQLSPSGKYLSTFPREHHRRLWIHRWDFQKNQISFLKEITSGDLSRWLEMRLNGRGHFIRWSTNSDKWLTLMYGNNVVLINWIENQAIHIGRREGDKGHVPNFFRSPGALWVDGPQGSYETAKGEWVRIGEVNLAVEGFSEEIAHTPVDEDGVKVPQGATLSEDAATQRTQVRATLVEKTPWSEDIALSASYPNALIVYRYKIEQILEGRYDNDYLHVVHWAARDRKAVDQIIERPLKRSYVITVEPLELHPDVETEPQLHGIEAGLELPLMLDLGDARG